LKDIMCLTIY